MCAMRDNGTSNGSKHYFGGLAAVMSRLPYRTIDEIADVLHRCFQDGRTVFLIGNGGSAALASHFACDLGKGTTEHADTEKRFRAIALTDNIPLMTAWANDQDYEDIFLGQLRTLLKAGDVVFAISGSGNSRNVLKALHFARETGALVVGLSGYAGGKMKELCDICLVVPSDNMQHIEDLHLCVAHSLYTTLRRHIMSAQVTASAATTGS